MSQKAERPHRPYRRMWIILGGLVGVLVSAWGLQAKVVHDANQELAVEVERYRALGINVDPSPDLLYLPTTNPLSVELAALDAEAARSFVSLRLQGTPEAEEFYQRLRKQLESPEANLAYPPRAAFYLMSKTERVAFDHSQWNLLQACTDRARHFSYSNANWERCLEAMETCLRIQEVVPDRRGYVWTDFLQLLSSQTLTVEQLRATETWLKANAPSISLRRHVERQVRSTFLEMNGDYQALRRLDGDAPLTERLSAAFQHTTARQQREKAELLRNHYQQIGRLCDDLFSAHEVINLDLFDGVYHLSKEIMAWRVAYASTWVQLERHRTGAWPDALPNEPEFTDGYTGKPLEYRPNGSEFSISFIGRGGSPDDYPFAGHITFGKAP